MRNGQKMIVILLVLFSVHFQDVHACSGSGSFAAARARAFGAASHDNEMRAAKCERADFGVYKAPELRQLATIYEIPGDTDLLPVTEGGKLSCSFDKMDDGCAWYAVKMPQMLHRAGFETTLDLNRFDCTSDRSFPFTDHFLLVGGESIAFEGSAGLEAGIPCQYDKSTLKFDYWANNETPVMKICVIPEDTLEPNCEESRLDVNPLTFEIPQSLKPFRIRVQIDHIGESDVILIDNIIYEGTICELVQEDPETLQKARAEGTSNFNADPLSTDNSLLEFETSTTASTRSHSHFGEVQTVSDVAGTEILPDVDNRLNLGENAAALRPDYDKEEAIDACKALECSFNYGDACFYRLSGLGGTAAWKLGQGLLGNPHTGVHRHNPTDNRTSGFAYIGLDNNDFSSEVFVLESARFRLSEPAYLTFDLYQRSMGPQLKICINGLEDCPYSNPPLEPESYWLTDQRVLLNQASEKTYFIAGNVKQNLYLAIDNLRLQTVDGDSFCPPNSAASLLARKKYSFSH